MSEKPGREAVPDRTILHIKASGKRKEGKLSVTTRVPTKAVKKTKPSGKSVIRTTDPPPLRERPRYSGPPQTSSPRRVARKKGKTSTLLAKLATKPKSPAKP